MKLLLFASCIAVYGCSASNPADDPFQQMQREINKLKLRDEALRTDYEEKIKSLEKNYGEKIARLEQQLASGRNLVPHTGTFFKTPYFLSI